MTVCVDAQLTSAGSNLYELMTLALIHDSKGLFCYLRPNSRSNASPVSNSIVGRP